MTESTAPGSDDKTEQNLGTVEELQALLATTSDVITVLDEHGTITYQTPSATDVLGYTQQSLVGENAFKYVHPEDREETANLFGELVGSPDEESRRVEMRFRHADGHWVWLESVGTNQRNTMLDGFVVTSRDITARRRLEERYQQFVEYASDMVTVVDREGIVQYVSPSAEDITGYSLERLDGHNIQEFVHQDHEEDVRAAFERTLDETSEAVTVEYRFEHANGSVRWFESRGQSLPEDGAFEGQTVINTRDITERKLREAQLEQYETALKTVPDGVFLLDSEGTMLRVNDAWASLVGSEPEALVGTSFSALVDDGIVSEKSIEAYSDVVRELLEGDSDRERGSFTARATPPTDDAEHVYEVHIRLLPSETGFDGTVGLVRDVTEQVEQRKRLERENERLDEFASIVSHDLRNPLSVLQGSLEAMDAGDDGHHARSLRAVDRMDRLIDDLLVLARHGDAEADQRSLDIGDVARRGWETAVTEDADLVIEDGGHIEADPGQCQQLFENLFRNSIEHAESAADDITVRIGFTDDGFYVADDGPGFDDIDESRLFESGYSTMQGGTGFGLKIVEEIADTHGWEVEPTTSDAGGARFDIHGLENR